MMNYLCLYCIIIHLLIVLHFELSLDDFFLDPLGHLSICVRWPKEGDLLSEGTGFSMSNRLQWVCEIAL